MTQQPTPPEDGVSYVYIHPNGRTELGRLLDPTANTPFVHSKYGWFASWANYANYLKTGMKYDVVRNMVGNESDRFVEEAGAVSYPPMDILYEGIRLKTIQNPRLMDLLMRNTLPLKGDFYQSDLWHSMREECLTGMAV